MLDHYTLLITNVFSLKKNENLTHAQQIDEVHKILSKMKDDAEVFAKAQMKKDILKRIELSLKDL